MKQVLEVITLKKILAAALALMLSVSVLASCGSKDSDSKAKESKAAASSAAESTEESKAGDSKEESKNQDENTPVDIKEMPSYLANQETASIKFTTDMNVEDIVTPLGEYDKNDESHVTLTIEELEGVPMIRVQTLDKDKEGKYLIPKLQFHMENLFKGKESELPKIFTIKADVIAKAVGTYHSEETGDDMMVPGWAGGRMVTQPYDGSTNTWNELVDWEIQEWTSEWAYSEFMCRPGIKDVAKFQDTTQGQFFTIMKWGIANQADLYIANLTFLDEDGNVLECSYGK